MADCRSAPQRLHRSSGVTIPIRSVCVGSSSVGSSSAGGSSALACSPDVVGSALATLAGQSSSMLLPQLFSFALFLVDSRPLRTRHMLYPKVRASNTPSN